MAGSHVDEAGGVIVSVAGVADVGDAALGVVDPAEGGAAGLLDNRAGRVGGEAGGAEVVLVEVGDGGSGFERDALAGEGDVDGFLAAGFFVVVADVERG